MNMYFVIVMSYKKRLLQFKGNNRLLSKLAYRKEFERDTEHRTAAYTNVTLLDKKVRLVAQSVT
ncbi:MAG: palindromic element RPE1 domain-containing protein [Candidatus Tisiphia sp.]